MMELSPSPSRRQRKQLERDNKAWPMTLRYWPKEEWPIIDNFRVKPPDECWRSRHYLVQIFYERDGVERLSIIRTSHDGKSWADNIPWDDIQRLKSECGRGDKDAIEIYPADALVVNVANMRHIFVLPEPHPLTWRKGQ